MTNDILILGGTGTTGRRLADLLRDAGETVRVAARSRGDVHFDWDDPATHGPALAGVDRVYLLPPTMRSDHAAIVGAFLQRAAAAGVRHVTLLSARGIEHAPPQTALRAIELDLASRDAFTHSIVRPAWFMQNFSEGFLGPAIVRDAVIMLPAGDGSEAFVDVADIAAVAAATLRDPEQHAGAAYAVAGPEALTHDEVAQTIAAATGRDVRFADVARTAWLDGALSAGLPAEYATMLADLIEVIRAGHGARPTDDVARVTGRQPGTLAQFAEHAAATGAWNPSAAVRAA